MTRFILLSFLIIFSIGCKPSPEELLKEKIDSYIKGVPEQTIDDILQLLISINSTDHFPVKNIDLSDKLIKTINNNKLTLILDNNIKKDISKDNNYFDYDDISKNLVLSNGTECSVFNFNEDEKKIFEAKLSDNRNIAIDSILINDEDIFYFFKRKLYKLNITSNDLTAFCKDKTFSPPYSKFKFNVNMKLQGSILAFTTGIGGEYYLSIIDTLGNKCLKKDIRTASGRFTIYNNSIFYVEGAAGKWSLIEYNFFNKEKQTIKTFNEISDIIFSKNSIYFKEKETFIFYSLNLKSTFILPENLQPIKEINNKFCYKYIDTYYLCYEETIINALFDLSTSIPEIIKEI